MRYFESLPGEAHHLHSARYALRWSDMDAFGHINNALYFTYFEQVRVEWPAALGVAHELVLANVWCTFFKPLAYPGEVEVALYAGHVGRSSFDAYYKLRCADQPDVRSPGRCFD
jgi:acyl-CoA thioester hydrolase